MHLSHIPQYTTLAQKCEHFCSKVVYCGIWDMCIVGCVGSVLEFACCQGCVRCCQWLWEICMNSHWSHEPFGSALQSNQNSGQISYHPSHFRSTNHRLGQMDVMSHTCTPLAAIWTPGHDRVVVKEIFLPSSAIDTDGYCRRSMRPLVRLSASNDVTALTVYKDFSYRPEMLWGDAQYHEADRYSKGPCSANFYAFRGILKFPW